MSFFKNLRKSVTPNRNNSSKQFSSAVKINKSGCKSVLVTGSNNINNNNSKTRNNSKKSNTSDTSSKQRRSSSIKSIEEDTQSLGSLLRSDTFTIDDNTNNIILKKSEGKRKNSKKGTMFEKFSTFTRRKKSGSPRSDEKIRSSENDQFTYKRWPTPSDDDNIEINSNNNDNSDPFNCFYEKPHSASVKSDRSSSERGSLIIDYGTYKKNKIPINIKEQLDEMKYQHPESIDEQFEECENDKYKTVTINSFRKSFRDKFLAQQKQSPAYNPSWFVEVDPPLSIKTRSDNDQSDIRPDILIFDNDNYRSTARSPTIHRDLSNSPVRHSSPPSTTAAETLRSNVNLKRHETFKIDRHDSEQPSIRIEIKNSITPNEPGRIVPVGVAKPIQSYDNENWPIKHGQNINNNNTNVIRPKRNKNGGYQTCIQIKQDYNKYPIATNYLGGQSKSTMINSKASRIHITPASGEQKVYINNPCRYTTTATTTTNTNNNYKAISNYDVMKKPNLSNSSDGYINNNAQPMPTQNRKHFGGDNLLRQQNHDSRSKSNMSIEESKKMIESVGRKKWNKSNLQQPQQPKQEIQQQPAAHQRKQWIKPSPLIRSQSQQIQVLQPSKTVNVMTTQQKPRTGFTGYIVNKWNRKDLNRSSSGLFTTNTNPTNVPVRRSRSPIKIPWR